MSTPPEPPTPDMADQLIAFLTRKWGNDPKCPMCENTTWHVTPPIDMEAIPQFKPPEWGSFPVCGVVCSNCGDTHFVSGVLAGLFPPRDVADAEPQPEVAEVES